MDQKKIREIIQVVCVAGVALTFLGCRTQDYKRRADKEAYKILDKAQDQIGAGGDEAFSIETEYTDRKHQEIPADEILEDRNIAETFRLDADGAIDLALETSRDYQLQKESLFLSALSLSGAEFAFDSRFFGGTRGTRIRSTTGERSGSLVSDFGFSRALITGGSLSAQLANNALRFYTGDPRKSVVSTLTFNIAQPLLRGAGRRIAVESLTQASRNVIYDTRDFNQFQHEFAVDILLSYFRLLQQKDVIRNRYSNYVNRVQSTAQLEAFYEAGRQNIVDLNQALQAELSSKISYVSTVANYETQLDQFKVQLGIPVASKVMLDDKAFEALELEGLPSLNVGSQDAFEIAIGRHPLVLNAIDRFEDQKRKLRIAANNLQADLRVFADGSLDSEGPTDYANFNIDDARFNYGVELDLPLNRLNERNQYRSTLITFERELRNLSLVLDNKRREIDLGIRTLDQLQRNYRDQVVAERISDLRVESSRLLFDAGRSTERDIREALDAQVASKNSVTVALVDYLQARLDLLLAMGILNSSEPAFWLKPNPVVIEKEIMAPEPEEADIEDIEIVSPELLFNEFDETES